MQGLSWMYGGNRVFTVTIFLVTPLFPIASQATGIYLDGPWRLLILTSQRPSITNFSSRSQILRPCLFSITVSHDGPNGICITNQPHTELLLESKASITSPVQNDNKQYCQCEHGQISSSEDHRHHNIRLRKLILPALLVLLTLSGLLVWSCVNWHGRSTWEVDSLVGRDSNTKNNKPIGQYSSTLFFSTHRS